MVILIRVVIFFLASLVAEQLVVQLVVQNCCLPLCCTKTG